MTPHACHRAFIPCVADGLCRYECLVGRCRRCSRSPVWALLGWQADQAMRGGPGEACSASFYGDAASVAIGARMIRARRRVSSGSALA